RHSLLTIRPFAQHGLATRRAEINRDQRLAGSRRLELEPLLEVPLLVERALFNVWENEYGPGGVLVPGDAGGGQGLEAVVVVVERQADLLEIVGTLRPGSGLAHLLHRGHEQGDQDGDDGDYDQQFNEGEAAAVRWGQTN